MKKVVYVAPETKLTKVELENGFMKGSVLDPENDQDKGVSIEGHEVGNEGDYTDLGWDQSAFNEQEFRLLT